MPGFVGGLHLAVAATALHSSKKWNAGNIFILVGLCLSGLVMLGGIIGAILKGITQARRQKILEREAGDMEAVTRAYTAGSSIVRGGKKGGKKLNEERPWSAV